MRQTDWTPGPWIAAPSGERMLGYAQSWGVGSHEGRNLIAGCFYDGIGGTDVAEANARLIAASPTMYSNLAILVDLFFHGHTVQQMQTAMSAARATLNELGPR